MDRATTLLEQEAPDPRVSDAWQDLLEQIHDGPLQELVAADLKLAALKRAAGHVRREDLDELTGLVQAAMGQLRRIVSEGYAEADEADLHARLVQLATVFALETGIECRMDVARGHVRLGKEVSAALYRAIRELLTNVRKHSGATRVDVTSAERADGTIELTVADNGVGVPERFATASPGPGDRGGFGLWSIEHRLGTFGILIEIDGAGGLTVDLVLPRRLLRR